MSLPLSVQIASCRVEVHVVNYWGTSLTEARLIEVYQKQAHISCICVVSMNLAGVPAKDATRSEPQRTCRGHVALELDAQQLQAFPTDAP